MRVWRIFENGRTILFDWKSAQHDSVRSIICVIVVGIFFGCLPKRKQKSINQFSPTLENIAIHVPELFPVTFLQVVVGSSPFSLFKVCEGDKAQSKSHLIQFTDVICFQLILVKFYNLVIQKYPRNFLNIVFSCRINGVMNVKFV